MSRHWSLFWALTRTEFRLRDQGTVLGFLWTLLSPVFHFLILYSLFTRWMGPLLANYPSYLLVGLIQWNFFATATAGGLTSLRRKAALVSNFSFPRIIVALSSVAAIFLSHLLEWALVLAALIFMGETPSLSWLSLPVLLAAELTLAAGVSCVLSLMFLPLRDLERVWSIFLYGAFFATPVFYSPEILSPGGRLLVAANPVASIIESTRGALFTGLAPGGAPFWGAVTLALVLGAAATAGFRRWDGAVAERL